MYVPHLLYPFLCRWTLFPLKPSPVLFLPWHVPLYPRPPNACLLSPGLSWQPVTHWWFQPEGIRSLMGLKAGSLKPRHCQDHTPPELSCLFYLWGCQHPRVPWLQLLHSHLHPHPPIACVSSPSDKHMSYIGLRTLSTLKAMAPHSSALAWKVPWTGEPGRLQSMGSLRVRHDWATSLSFFVFMSWRRKWQPTPVFLPGESQGRGSLVRCRLWGRTGSDTTEAT